MNGLFEPEQLSDQSPATDSLLPAYSIRGTQLLESTHHGHSLGVIEWRRSTAHDIEALRHVADMVEQTYGKIDIVVADAAIQRWKPLLEMEDSDWRDVIDNNLNGAASPVNTPRCLPDQVASFARTLARGSAKYLNSTLQSLR